MAIQFVDAEREKLFAKIAMIGASGSGKTVSALKLAYGLTGDWSKIFVVDTENKRALAYVGTKHTGLEIGKFKHAPMFAPFKTEHFAEAIDLAVKMGAEALIFDSFSHEWEGLGGVTHAAEEAGGDFWHWKGPKIAHRRLVDKIQQSPVHIIVTIRTKQEYAVIPGGGKNGKNAIEKLGMKPVQSNDLDYEFLIAFHVNEDNESVAKKDNTGLFGGEEFRIEAEHGAKLREWLIEGKEVKSVSEEKAEAEAHRQELVAYFQEARQKNEAWFTNKEIKAGKSLAEWDVDSLQKLYDMINKPKEVAATPEPEKEEGTKPGGNLIMETILEMVESNEDCKALHDEFLKKMKTTIDQVKPKQLQVLHNMLESKHKEVNKGA